MAQPRDLAARVERLQTRPVPDCEYFDGYGVMGLPFASGHILCLRRFPASSLGPGYTSLWHRDPDGEWTFYADVAPQESCNRFFGSAVATFRPAQIDIEWTGPATLTVTVPGKIDWRMKLRATPVTRLMNAMGGVMPEALWTNKRMLALMGVMASSLLGAGKLRLYGNAPNGQGFIANPRRIWMISQSRATLDGIDLGPPGPVHPQAWLGDFAIPNHGILAFGNAAFDPFDERRHLAAVTKAG